MARIDDEYFEWLVDLVTRDRFSQQISFNKLLTQLHNTEFRYSIPLDQNRALDGIDLRYRFAAVYGYSDDVLDVLPECCSMLEMMIALSIRCEEYIMDDPRVGDRTRQWFWGMVTSLGVGSFYDDRYDEDAVNEILQRFLDRDYEPDGRGGLFTVRHCAIDLRDVEIWRQLMRYLNSIV